MAFDPILAAQINKLKPPIGSPLMVPLDFVSPDYVEAGSDFDETQYPKLAAMTSRGFKGTKFKATPVPKFAGNLNGIASASGATQPRVMFRGSDGQLYLIFQNGNIFKTSDGTIATLRFYKALILPDRNSYTSISWGSEIHNGMLYMSILVSGSTTYNSYCVDLSDLTFETVTPIVMPYRAYQYAFKSNGTQLLAVMTSGAIGFLAYTEDGINFLNRTGNWTATYTAKGIDYGNGMWVVVTSGTGTMNVATSPDGITWTGRSVGTVGHNGIRYNSTLKMFAAIPSAAAAVSIYTSTDGIGWTARSIVASTVALNEIQVTANGAFVAYAGGTAQGANCVYGSTNGITWTVRNSGQLSYSAGSLLGSYQHAFCVENVTYIFGTLGAGNAQWSYSASTDNLVTLDTIYSLVGRDTTQTRGPVYLTDNRIGMILDAGSLIQTNQLCAALTNDGGETWNSINVTLPSSYIVDFSTFTSTPDRFFLCAYAPALTGVVPTSGTPSAFLLTSEDGINWTSTFVDNCRNLYVADNIVYNGAQNQSAFFSSNWGLSWSSKSYGVSLVGNPFAQTAGPNYFSFSASGSPITGVVVSHKGTIASRVNAPALSGTFDKLAYAGFGIYAMIFYTGVPPSQVYTDDLYVSEDGGVNWVLRKLPAKANTAVTISGANGWLYYISGPGVAYRSVDKGQTWGLVELKAENVDVSKYTWGSLVTNYGDAPVFLGGFAATKASGVYLEAITDTYSLSPIPSPMPGMKWVIKAK